MLDHIQKWEFDLDILSKSGHERSFGESSSGLNSHLFFGPFRKSGFELPGGFLAPPPNRSRDRSIFGLGPKGPQMEVGVQMASELPGGALNSHLETAVPPGSSDGG